MSSNGGRKYIARMTGLTGVEAGNVARKLEKKGIDYMTIDWKSIGENLYGHGKRTKGVKKQLAEMYGISISQSSSDVGKWERMGKEYTLDELMRFHNRRGKRARMIDMSLRAKKTFKATNPVGVALWKRKPNRYDIEGIDDPIKF